MNLYQQNHPKYFWRFENEIPDAIWQTAIQQAKPHLGISCDTDDIDEILQLTLGEGQFGTDHWRLNSLKRLYYEFKPFLPRSLTRMMRQFYQPLTNNNFSLGWPIEKRYALFLWEVGRQIMILTERTRLEYISFWPAGKQFAFVLTHDIETARGQEFVHQVADLEESLGFRSSFNFVPERYSIDYSLIDELKERGFEVGVHGLKHDGKLFNSRDEFEGRANLITEYLKSLGAVGFRAPLTHRHPEWMQALDIEYDLSFFDTDPFEPIPGGVMSIWPYFLGHFVELPYTLVQDYTLTTIIGEKTPKIWLEKVAFIKQFYGMALVNTHPDYLRQPAAFRIYLKFLEAMKEETGCWHALSQDVATWWRARAESPIKNDSPPAKYATAYLKYGELCIET